MSLELPADIEPYLQRDDMPFERLRGPACYGLELVVPDDLEERWDQHFDTRPDYLEEVQDAIATIYIGGANDLLHRLNDHNDGDVRKAALLQVCDIDSLYNVWWFESTDTAFDYESIIATDLQAKHPSLYFHQR